MLFVSFILLFVTMEVGICPPHGIPAPCHDALDGKNGFAVRPIQHSTDDGARRFDFVYKRKVRHNSCIIGNERHDLRIEFDVLTRTTDVLVSEKMVSDTEENSIGISLWQGSNSTRCKRTAGLTVTVYLSKFKFAVFSCKNAQHPNGLEANAIEISSNQRETVLDLDHAKRSGNLGWLVLAQSPIVMADEASSGRPKNCMPPALSSGQLLKPNKTSYDPGESVAIVCQSATGQQPIAQAAQRTCLNTGKWSGGDHVKCQQQPSPSKDCHPFEPYPGMPQRYNDYGLVLNGSINELLLQSPCREGYEHVGQLSDVKQCKGGVWMNKHFPKCEPIAIKPPPAVDHAQWYPVYDENRLMRHVIYVCDSGYGASTSKGMAAYSIEIKEWIDVPECRKLVPDSLELNLVIVIPIVVTVAVVVFLVVLIYFCQKTHSRRDRRASPDEEAQVLNLPDEEAQVLNLPDEEAQVLNPPYQEAQALSPLNHKDALNQVDPQNPEDAINPPNHEDTPRKSGRSVKSKRRKTSP